MSEWQNLGEQGSRKLLNKDHTIYQSRVGTYQAADDGGWLPGIYADEAAAVKALEVAQTHYGELARLAHWKTRGQGEDYQPITVADLTALTRKGT